MRMRANSAPLISARQWAEIQKITGKPVYVEGMPDEQPMSPEEQAEIEAEEQAEASGRKPAF